MADAQGSASAGGEVVYTNYNVSIHPSQCGTLMLKNVENSLVMIWVPTSNLIDKDNIMHILRAVAISHFKSIQLENGLEKITFHLPSESSFPLYFNDGGVEEFHETLSLHGYLVRPVKEAAKKPLQTPEVSADLSSQILRKLPSAFHQLYHVLVPEKRKHEQVSIEDEDQDPFAFEIVSKVWEAPRNQIHSLKHEEWVTFLDCEGRVIDVAALRKRIHYGGVDHNVRKKVWPLLLGYHSYYSTRAERAELVSIKQAEYMSVKAQWQSIEQSIEPEQVQSRKEFNKRESLIAQDVLGTDTSLALYEGDNNPSQKLLHDILLTYSYYTDLPYFQGMSDLLSPLLYVMGDEAEAFWCFALLMRCLRPNFEGNYSGVRSQLLEISKLVRLLDEPLHQHLQIKHFEKMCSQLQPFHIQMLPLSVQEHEEEMCSVYSFCYRWILFQLKKEFNFHSTLKLWEVLWARHICRHLLLYVCVAILKTYRSQILDSRSGMTFSELHGFILGLSGDIDLDSTLRYAEGLCMCTCPFGDSCIPTSPPHTPKNNNVGSIAANGKVATVADSLRPAPASSEATLGAHIARRLVEIGVSDVFSVPCDFNLTLLDYLIAEPGLNNVRCCNELNAGYAADGYARARGVGACVVTFTVGGLSILNAIAGAYSENLPVICLVSGPNTNDYGTNRILHHTIGLPDFTQELRCFQTVTCYQAVVNDLEDAHEQIDRAISTALKESKPVYISISCNLAGIPHPTFIRDPIPFSISPKVSNKLGLEAAVEAALTFLNKAVKPVLVGGPRLRVSKAGGAFAELADASGYPMAVMPSAKGLVPEHHPRFIGTYWGAVSTAFCAEIVESADAYVFVGPIFNDYSSVGHSVLLKKEKAIIVQPDRVVIGNGPAFGCVIMKEFLQELAKKIKKNTTAYENYCRIFIPDGQPKKSEPNEPLRVNVLFHHIQKMLSGDTAVIAETGDSWFNCQKLKLPEGCGYEFQMQYGSIGWSVGATLGYAQSVPQKRLISCIGDGSFQVTAQEVSTMISNGQKSIIFLINNGGYTIDVEIHDGPYNVIKNWNYTGVVEAFCNGEGNLWTTKVRNEEELVEAIATATGEKKDSLCFIEVFVHKDDTSKELLEWGSRVGSANGRPPNPNRR